MEEEDTHCGVDVEHGEGSRDGLDVASTASNTREKLLNGGTELQTGGQRCVRSLAHTFQCGGECRHRRQCADGLSSHQKIDNLCLHFVC